MNALTLVITLFSIINCNAQSNGGRYNGLLVDKFHDYTNTNNLNASQYTPPSSRGESDLPSSFSLEQYMPEIGDQGEYGSCVGWAIGYYAVSTQWNFQNGYISSKELDIFSPWYVWNNSKINNYRCDQGTYFNEALDWVSKYGVKMMVESPQKCIDKDSLDLMPANIVVEGWHTIFNKDLLTNCFEGDSMESLEIEKDFNTIIKQLTEVNDIKTNEEILQEMKGYISNGKPIVIGVRVGNTLKNYPANNEQDLDTVALEVPSGYNCNIRGLHAMCITAYDDKLLGGCFKVVNSWGEGWGLDGFMHLKYDDFFTITGSAYFLGDMKAVDPKLLDKKIAQNSIAGPQKHGLLVEYYANGKMKKETNYVRGLKSGIAKEYYENGKLRSEAKYKDDIPMALIKFDANQDTTDRIIATEERAAGITYDCMKKRGENIYIYEMVKGKDDDKEFKLTNKFKILKNGNLVIEGDFELDWDSDSKTYRSSPWRYFENNKLKHEFFISSSWHYEGLSIVGKYKTFDASGVIMENGVLENGQRHGYFQKYNNGELKSEGTYYENKRVGIWIDYDNSGKVLEKKIFGFD